MDANRLKQMGFEGVEIFDPAEVLNPDQTPGSPSTKNMVVVRVYTDKGWQYGKFNPGDDAGIEAWAAKRTPAKRK